MAISEFYCTKCNLVIEHIRSVHDPVPDWKKCPKCGGRAEYKVSAVAVATSGMSQAPIDVVIGRDAEARWADINKRKAAREQVRRESGQEAVRETKRNEFTPIKGGHRKLVNIPDSKVGFDSSKDEKLVKK